jgi:hypothetical protein
MKIEIDWRVPKTGSSGFHGIRLYPETNEEMADLERFKSCKLKPNEYHRIVSGEHINYLITFQDEKIFEYPQKTEKQFFWNRLLEKLKIK